ncbi:isoprenoid synthase domain-containing protein [Dipodascopsis uninucleata]
MMKRSISSGIISTSSITGVRLRWAIEGRRWHSHTHSHSHDDWHDHSHSHSVRGSQEVSHNVSQINTAHPVPEPPQPIPVPPTPTPTPPNPVPPEPPLSVGRARDLTTSMLQQHAHSESLISPFIPSKARDAYIGLVGLWLTMRRTVHSTGSTSASSIGGQTAMLPLAQMRLRFWKSTVDEIFTGSTPPAEPVLVLISDMVRNHVVTKSFLLKMLDSISSRLGDPPFGSIADMTSYGDGVYASLLYAIADCNVGQTSENRMSLDHIMYHIGCAKGIVDILRDLPTALRRGRVLLPIEIQAKYGLRDEDLLRRKDMEDPTIKHKLSDAIFEIATHANDQLITARTTLKEVSSKKKLSDSQFAPLLTSLESKLFLEKLEKQDFDIFSPKLHMRPWTLPWKLYWAYQRRTI